MTPLESASALWREWEQQQVLRPATYDKDLADLVRSKLQRDAKVSVVGEGLADAMDAAAWTPRDLLRALAPAINSFSKMQKDLLALCERIGATSGAGTNLRVRYEFSDGDPIDDALSAFRERVTRIERVAVSVTPLGTPPPDLFHRPLPPPTFPEGAPGRWSFAEGLPTAPPSGHDLVDRVAQEWTTLAREVLTALAAFGGDPFEACRTLEGEPPVLDDDDRLSILRAYAYASTDRWIQDTAQAAVALAERVRAGEPPDEVQLHHALSWAQRFRPDRSIFQSVDLQVEALRDILSLPTWRKRHDLYSAWVVTQVDAALGHRHLTFIVENGTLRFPFTATRLATLDPPYGDLELWCEVRSAASTVTGKGRSANIQPDLRFVEVGVDPSVGTRIAIEAKQYRHAAASTHGTTLRDYVLNLPDAQVVLVGHGPIGESAISKVPAADRHRASVLPDVRPGSARPSAEFRKCIRRSFDLYDIWPNDLSIRLRWDPDVHDLDIHITDDAGELTWWQRTHTQYATLRDAFDGGPETAVMPCPPGRPLTITVHTYDAPGSVYDADPCVTLVAGTTDLLEIAPRRDQPLPNHRAWEVLTVHSDAAIKLGPLSRQVPRSGLNSAKGGATRGS